MKALLLVGLLAAILTSSTGSTKILKDNLSHGPGAVGSNPGDVIGTFSHDHLDDESKAKIKDFLNRLALEEDEDNDVEDVTLTDFNPYLDLVIPAIVNAVNDANDEDGDNDNSDDNDSEINVGEDDGGEYQLSSQSSESDAGNDDESDDDSSEMLVAFKDFFEKVMKEKSTFDIQNLLNIALERYKESEDSDADDKIMPENYEIQDVLDGKLPRIQYIEDISTKLLADNEELLQKYATRVQDVIQKRNQFLDAINEVKSQDIFKRNIIREEFQEKYREAAQELQELKRKFVDKRNEYVESRRQLQNDIIEELKAVFQGQMPWLKPEEFFKAMKHIVKDSPDIQDAMEQYSQWMRDAGSDSSVSSDSSSDEGYDNHSESDQSTSSESVDVESHEDDIVDLRDLIKGRLPDINFIKNHTKEVIEKYLDFLKQYIPDIEDVIRKREKFFETLDKVKALYNNASKSIREREAEYVQRTLQELRDFVKQLKQQREEWLEERKELYKTLVEEIEKVVEESYPDFDPFELIDILGDLEGKIVDVKSVIKQYGEWVRNKSMKDFVYKRVIDDDDDKDPGETEDDESDSSEERSSESETGPIGYHYRHYDDDFTIGDVLDGKIPNINFIENYTCDLVEKYVDFLNQYIPNIKEVIQKRQEFFDSIDKIQELREQIYRQKVEQDVEYYYNAIQQLKTATRKMVQQKKEWIQSRIQLKRRLVEEFRKNITDQYDNFDPFEFFDVLETVDGKEVVVRDLMRQYGEWSDAPERSAKPFVYDDNGDLNLARASGNAGSDDGENEGGMSGVGTAVLVLGCAVCVLGTATTAMYMYRKKRRQRLYTKLPGAKYRLDGFGEEEKGMSSSEVEGPTAKLLYK